MPTMTLLARGHPGITGRHAKTLELTADPEITARASCVVGVAAAMPAGLRELRGTVRLDIAAGDVSSSVTGEVNPGYAAAGSLIVRRSDVLDADTFLVNASAAAADLPRDLVAALADPRTGITVTATETGTPDPVVLVLGTGAGGTAEVPSALAGLAGVAEIVVDLTPAGAPPPPVPLGGRRVHGWPASLAGVRTVVVLGEPETIPLDLLPRRRVVTWPPSHPGAELLLAAGLPTAPVLLAGAQPAGAALRALAAVAHPVVLAASGAGVATLRTALPDHDLLLPDPSLGWGTAVTRETSDLAGLRRYPHVVLLPPRGEQLVGTNATTLARLLRREDVSGRSAAAVLAALGVPRKDAYRLATER